MFRQPVAEIQVQGPTQPWHTVTFSAGENATADQAVIKDVAPPLLQSTFAKPAPANVIADPRSDDQTVTLAIIRHKKTPCVLIAGKLATGRVTAARSHNQLRPPNLPPLPKASRSKSLSKEP